MSEVQGRPTSTMSTERRYGIAISVALILGGLYWALTGLTEGTKSGQESYPVQGDTLLVKGGSAEIEIRPGDGSQVKVERQFERNVFGHEPKEKYNEGKLELKDSGCGFLSFGCKTSYVLTVPKDVKLTVESSSGDVTLSGMPDGATLKTSSGDIELHDTGGPLWLESSSGDLQADGLTATEVTTKSSSGSVDLNFAVAPTAVNAEASSGDVSIQIPAGSESYKVETDTSSGDQTTEVKTDPTSTRTIKADTSSGDVTVQYNQ
jgi:DUF4097 and DUF4098 domain-containing protein YvlB